MNILLCMYISLLSTRCVSIAGQGLPSNIGGLVYVPDPRANLVALRYMYHMNQPAHVNRGGSIIVYFCCRKYLVCTYKNLTRLLLHFLFLHEEFSLL